MHKLAPHTRLTAPRLFFPAPRKPWPLGALILIVAVAAIVTAQLDMSPMLSSLLEQASKSHATGLVLLLLYTVLLAMPFVPGAEIGLALLVVFGAVMAWPVYVATVLALSIAFAIGRLASGHHTRPAFGTVSPSSDPILVFEDRLHHRRWCHRLMRYRWLALVALINMPGNTVIGGGGGIAMAVGYSRTFTYPTFLACTAVAVAPVPTLVLLAEITGFGERLSDWIKQFI